MQLANRFGTSFLLKDGKGKQLAPLEGDFKGDLTTGETPLVITKAKPAEVKKSDQQSDATKPGADDTELEKKLRRAKSSVVIVRTAKPEVENGVNRKVNGIAMGLVVDHRGYILTTSSIFQEIDAEATRVTFNNDAAHPAELIAIDDSLGLALLRVTSKESLTPPPFGKSADLKQGDAVFAITPIFAANSANVTGLTTTNGTISGLHRQLKINDKVNYENLVETDMSGSVGSIGGPLLNAAGEVVGVIGVVRVGQQKMAFAKEIDDVLPFLAKSIPPP